MMSKLRAKVPTVRLAQTNAAAAALRRRSIRCGDHDPCAASGRPVARGAARNQARAEPGGVYLNSGIWHDETAPSRRLRNYWRERIEITRCKLAATGTAEPGGIDRRTSIAKRGHLRRLKSRAGVHHRRYVEEIDSLASRQFSESWNIPDDVFNMTLDELRAWAAHECGDLDQSFDERTPPDL